MKWAAPYYPIRALAPNERKFCVSIKFKGLTPGKCGFCGGGKIDTCYNCEKPMCENHGIPFVMMTRSNGQPMFILNVCPECVRDNGLKEGRSGPGSLPSSSWWLGSPARRTVSRKPKGDLIREFPNVQPAWIKQGLVWKRGPVTWETKNRRITAKSIEGESSFMLAMTTCVECEFKRDASYPNTSCVLTRSECSYAGCPFNPRVDLTFDERKADGTIERHIMSVLGDPCTICFKDEEEMKTYDYFQTVADNIHFDMDNILKSGRRCWDCYRLLAREDIRNTWDLEAPSDCARKDKYGVFCLGCFERALKKHHEKLDAERRVKNGR